MNIVLMIQENKLLLFIYRKISSILKVFPYYVVMEKKLGEDQVRVTPLIDDIEVCFLNADDMKEIAAHPEVELTESNYVNFLNKGYLCLGAKKDGKILGYTWCRFDEYEFKNRRVKLKDNEAYLFDARTFREYRGKNLAPFLRYQMYAHLSDKGITDYYSLTIYPNTSSLVFKRKLGGRPVRLFLYISLFNSVHIHVPLKKYI